ncbi:hypothetical protein SAMN05421504_105460 [Amycolatopsis xylanica]|uniref:Beta-lactamase enzyme family protein n=1 Tax=Amycolatopsis xylanica TaxID=589385 RepID=A0A1H3JLE3_9PSEU|nr:class A beta-lactamase-related serine hydrolase [Amycolatopsis xylanica]SDY40707.1 hypothetical protein SAMN05421504_105460 [Amycolatopsis xylanica]
MNIVRSLSFLLAGTALAASLGGVAAAAPSALPDGMTAGYLVFDRVTGTSSGRDEHKRFRSASVVKLLIALDYLESRGPDQAIPADDRALLEPMLRSSDNNGANVFWVRDGGNAIIDRMVARLGLRETAPPTVAGMWGYTAISAADVVKIYQYLLTTAHPKYRDFIMGNLRQTTKCSPDGFDQSFGIPSALPRPWAVKQGWSKFGDRPGPGEECEGAYGRAAAEPDLADGDVDLDSRAMHTTGTVGQDDRTIVAVLTLEPTTVSWRESVTRITDLTRSVYAGGS